MLLFLKLLFVLAVVAFYLYKRKKNKINTVSNGYAFGLEEAKEVLYNFNQQAYDKVESILAACNADNLSVCIDYLALQAQEDRLQDWYQNAKDKTYSQLVLGVFYNHLAWKSRTHAFAEEVDLTNAKDFFEFHDKSIPFLEAASKKVAVAAEAHARMVRHYMGVNNKEQVGIHFIQACNHDAVHLWAHVHYAEAIQSKWGGSREKIKLFIDETASKPKLLKQMIELKVAVDSFLVEENYFGGSWDDLPSDAIEILTRIDDEVSKNPPVSIHRYMLYNYLFALSNELKNNKLSKKYFGKMEGYYTLYPFGILA